MNFLNRLEQSIVARTSYLCVGLDPDTDQFPVSISRDVQGAEQYLRTIVDATRDYACVYKPNLAFFGALGLPGFPLLRDIIAYAQQTHPVILDGKFGDIGNTAKHYASLAFDSFGADAVTVNPYLGTDSLEPFFEREDRFAFLLGVTSNPGAADIQKQAVRGGGRIFENLSTLLESKFPQPNWGWVAGATQIADARDLRKRSPERWFLIPGVGAQGGDMGQALAVSQIPSGEVRCVINASRSILYASNEGDYAEAAREAARSTVESMRSALS